MSAAKAGATDATTAPTTIAISDFFKIAPDLLSNDSYFIFGLALLK
jgi:hypothetical protein